MILPLYRLNLNNTQLGERENRDASMTWVNLKEHFEARVTEWFGGAVLAVWGAYLTLTPGIFDGPVHLVWSGLASIAPQVYWGFGAFLVGVIRLVALFITGQWGLTPIIRVFTSFASIFVWFWVMVGFYRAGIQHPGFIIYGALIMADMFSAHRAASDAYEIEAYKKIEQLSRQVSNVEHLDRHRR